MSNAELFKNVFGIYAEEFWAYPKEKMLDWLTSDVPDRRDGKWIEAKPMSGRIGKVCSACGCEAYWDSDYGQQLFDWCPYCGAEMEGEDDE